MLAIASEPTWSKEDGNLQEETVKEFLTQAKKIYDNEISGISDSEKEEFLNSVRGSDDSSGTAEETALDISWSILNFLTKSQAQLAIGASQQVSLDFTNVISVPRVKPEVVYKPLSLQAENVFQAESIVGVSAKAAEPEMAREFVEMLLSYNVMSMQQEPYPVTQPALTVSLIRIWKGMAHLALWASARMTAVLQLWIYIGQMRKSRRDWNRW